MQYPMQHSIVSNNNMYKSPFNYKNQNIKFQRIKKLNKAKHYQDLYNLKQIRDLNKLKMEKKRLEEKRLTENQL
uniref:Uncharacterized protein n=1 Tax=Mimivirus LCMiAC02 TaxID=2506609 RepID=A0A4D5XF15_9VIRU|nr:MAG: hypothetical protein LCMiAC02_03830 [Mimivirus LCMiAC02]